MNYEDHLREVVAKEIMSDNMLPLVWLEAMDETGFANDGLTKKSYLRLRLEVLREEENLLIEGLVSSDCLAKAKQGDPEAQVEVGVAHASLGDDPNLVAALAWFRRAADKAYAPAQHHLAVCHRDGAGVVQESLEAVKWYGLAAEQGHAVAQCGLGVHYYRGIGVPRDEVEAVKWFYLSAEQGYHSAQCNLGKCYLNGDGVSRDAIEAAKWYRLAAEQGDLDAQKALGAIYLGGRGVPTDEAEAVRWLRLAAEGGDAASQYTLGHGFYEGVFSGLQGDEALRWIHFAAAQDFVKAQSFLDEIATYGCNLDNKTSCNNSLLENATNEIEMFRLAAEEGIVEGQYMLGIAYRDGNPCR